MVPLARGSILAVILEEVKTDMELGAGGGVHAGAVWTVAFVVVKADLEGRQQRRSSEHNVLLSASHSKQQDTDLRQQKGIVLQ